MTQKWISIVGIIFSFLGSSYGQKQICGNHNDQLKAQLNGFTFQNPVHGSGIALSSSIVYEIPVVVHVFHDNDALGTQYNPSDATIQSIIAQASQRFRHQHPGAKLYTNPYYGIDTEISLCLAKRDPTGHASNGIVRYNNATLATGNGLDLSTSFLDYVWNRQYYCNIIVMREMQDACGWYLGSLDATLYDSGCFWSGLVAHEIGHYFSLLHTFQNNSCVNNDCDIDGDQICDTPVKSVAGFNDASSCDSPNNDCATDEDDPSANNPYRAASAGGLGEQPDMLANYLDYTGGCWDSFTQGQKDRMRARIETFRPRMINNPSACSGNPDQILVTQCYDINANASNHATTTNIHFQSDVIPAAINKVIEMSIYVYGYIPFSGSTFDIMDENMMLLGTTNADSSNYSCFASPDFTMMVDPSMYNNWIADGSIDFVFSTHLNICTIWL